MKLLTNGIRIGFACLFLSILIQACSKMDDTYKQFLEGGMKVYIGMVDSVFVYPGNHRIQLGWLPPSDPKATFTRVYWNNRTDSIDVPITRTENRDTIKVMLDDFAEETYVFEVFTFDNEGHQSLKKEVVSRVYGDRYNSTLLSRPIDSYEIGNGDTLRINWGALPDVSVHGSEFIYEDENGDTQTLFVSKNDNVTYIENFSAQTIKHRTSYLPTSLAIDTFYTEYESLRIKGEPIELSKAGWTAVASSEDVSGNRRASHAIDENPSTLWVSQIGGTVTYPNHTITVDMGVLHENLEGFAIITRLNPGARPKVIELYTSVDGNNWTAHGTHTLANSPEKQWIALTESVQAQYFRLIGIEPIDNNEKNIALAEIGMYYR
ncbi:DUF4998 domain-containing protein [Sphingobacterium chuzhouense]|uniref:Discoidin domain-containing protein n=1 Tax=Sphingobacterium chuzhouense TaxID=1742264 RepID=A0ABR7XPC7_9SPHI|nr:DUF4998 domain-containing protein [Sphingobacterium chuzhouense]MBD1420712.1 discoidin domain-containing protein [Sphingobacterium chuzhouense]